MNDGNNKKKKTNKRTRAMASSPKRAQDYTDSLDDVLPSFPAIRKKTLETLYRCAENNETFISKPTDKSPKGSVDERILPLVDLINLHPSFATLSSCSGRITLFDPAHTIGRSNNNNEEELSYQTSSVKANGKGGLGGWMLSSHEEIDLEDLLVHFRPKESLQEKKTQHDLSTFWTFKFEPMLLHVAASTYKRGQQFLQLALGLGFRESGLVATSNRVTVAVRTHSLAMAVPLSREGPFRPSKEYLEALTVEANNRLRTNWIKIRNLYQQIEESLFRSREGSCCHVKIRSIPSLNLWGHAAVAVPRGNTSDVDILVFGGYGCKPHESLEFPEKNTRASKRSDLVYRLRRESGLWNGMWDEINLSNQLDSASVENGCFGLAVSKTNFTSREGLDACLLSTVPSPFSSSAESASCRAIVIFGGRKGPAQPLGDLLLCEYSLQSLVLQKPTDVRGENPEPRWNHSLTSLLCSTNGIGEQHLAVLLGGRNHQTAFSSIHILSLIKTPEENSTVGNERSHLLWESIASPLPRRGLFDHSTICTGSTMFVFGGLSELDDLFADSQPASAFSLSTSSRPLSVTRKEVNIGGIPKPQFGQAACLLQSFGKAEKTVPPSQQTVLLSGGVSACFSEDKGPPGYDDDDNAPLQCFTISQENSALNFRPLPLILSLDSGVDFGSLVSHRCLNLPSMSDGCDELALVGGGVPGFGFSQCFAKSYHVEIFIQESVKKDVTASSKNKEMQSCRNYTGRTTNTSDKQASSAPAVANVVYVLKQDAKLLKTLLEGASLLDKSYRMVAADKGAVPAHVAYLGMIAVPVTNGCLAMLEKYQQSDALSNESGNQKSDWRCLVKGTGQQQVPYSTAMFAKKCKNKKW